MSTFHYAIYTGLGLSFVALGLWRVTRPGGGVVRLAALVTGLAVLAVVAASLLDIVSTDGVEACINSPGRRSKLLICLRELRWNVHAPE